MRQWRDDIDRLIILAQATPGSTGTGSGQRRRQGGAPTFARFPTVGSARTADLRAELNRRRAGEDARVSMERARERRLNIEGRNLDADLGAAAPRSQGHIQTPVAGVGCVALAEHLHAVAWPPKFRPHLPEKYNGTTNPSEFLQVYITVITGRPYNFQS